MPKYLVSGPVYVTVSIKVEADSKEEAMIKADNEFCGISGYCGNGGFNKLIGVYGSNESIVGEDYELTDVDECGEE